MHHISQNIEKIKQNIAQACLKVQRDPKEINIVAVTKTVGINETREAINNGLINIGENRVQEAAFKYSKLADCEHITWHMIGRLQRNKVKLAVELFDLIHSVDSLKLAQEIDRRAKQQDKIMPILVQVNVSGEESKQGVSKKEVEEFCRQIIDLPNLSLQGLMTMAPLVDNPEEVRPLFRTMKELFIEIPKKIPTLDKWQYLSMGMTQDYQIAVEEGANLLRIGTAIFA